MAHLSDQVLALRVATLYQKVSLSTGETLEEDSSHGSNKGRVPPRWREWLESTQQGGKRMVPNPSPNPLSRERHRQVSFNTALKDKHFYQEAMKAYQAWVEKAEQKEKSKEKPTDEKPEGKPEAEAKPERGEAKPEEHKAPKKSWKERMKGMGAKALDFVKNAPQDVKKFLEDDSHRRKILHGIHKSLVEAPEKLVKNAVSTVKQEVHEYKEAGSGVKAVLKGGKMSTSQKKAFKTVATHLAISIAASALVSSGPLGLAGTLAKGMAKSLALKSVSRALGHVAVLEEVGHIGHGVAQFVSHLASERNSSEVLYRYAAEVEEGGDPDVDDVFGNFMAANVAKELETFGSDEDVDSVLESFDSEPSDEEEEDLDLEEPTEEEPTEEPPSDDENIVKVNLKDVSEIWFVKNQGEGAEKMSSDNLLREYEDALIAERVASEFITSAIPKLITRLNQLNAREPTEIKADTEVRIPGCHIEWDGNGRSQKAPGARYTLRSDENDARLRDLVIVK